MAFELLGAPYKLGAEKYGGLLTAEDGVVTVQTTVTTLVAADPERVLLAFINLSLNVVFVAPRANVSTSRGIRLAPNGGFLSLNADDDGVLQALDWFAVTDVGTASVYRISENRISSG